MPMKRNVHHVGLQIKTFVRASLPPLILSLMVVTVGKGQEGNQWWQLERARRRAEMVVIRER